MPAPRVEIRYCTKCRFILRTSWLSQELLFTFGEELGEVALVPGSSGELVVAVDGRVIFDRKEEGRFPEAKELKQLVRDLVAPDKDLGHSERGEDDARGDDVLSTFVLERGFWTRKGPAHAAGAYCNKKLCFTSTALRPMAELLHGLSLRSDCYWVKLDERVGDHGMVRGRCFLTTEEAVGQFWRDHKVGGDILCTIQDDDFTVGFRPAAP